MDAETFTKILEVLMDRYSIQSSPTHIQDKDPFKVLVGAMLSHRTKDEITDEAFNKLFSEFRSIHEISKAPVKKIERLIKPVGFYRQKAKRIKEVTKILLKRYGGKVPEDRDELLKLPGVGYKTADIVLSIAYGKPVIAVDTHVETISKRLGLVGMSAKYEEIRRTIENLTPIGLRPIVNNLLVKFGKEICRKQRPRCNLCPVTCYCEWYKHKTASRV